MKKNGNKGIGKGNLLITLIFFGLVIARVGVLHSSDLINHRHYTNPVVSENLVRGSIYDRNGNILAIQAPDYGFYISLKNSSPSHIASLIEPYISLSAIEAANEIQNGRTFFELRDIPDSKTLEYIDNILLNSSMEDEVKLHIIENRKYPSGSCTEDLIGEVDEYMEGVSGIEKILNESLKASPVLDKNYVKGSDAVLTLDLDLQFALTSVPTLSMNENVSAAILSSKGEVLAYQGPITDSLLENMVISITSAERTINLEPTFPNETIKNGAVPADETLSYFIYADSSSPEVKNKLIEDIENILISQGRIKNS